MHHTTTLKLLVNFEPRQSSVLSEWDVQTVYDSGLLSVGRAFLCRAATAITAVLLTHVVSYQMVLQVSLITCRLVTTFPLNSISNVFIISYVFLLRSSGRFLEKWAAYETEESSWEEKIWEWPRKKETIKKKTLTLNVWDVCEGDE